MVLWQFQMGKTSISAIWQAIMSILVKISCNLGGKFKCGWNQAKNLTLEKIPPLPVTIIFKVHAIVFRDLMCQIRQNWDVQRSQTALFSRYLSPRQMSEMRIYWNGHNLSVQSSKFFITVIKGQNFGGTHKSKVQRVKEKYQVFSSIVSQFDFFHLTFDHGCTFPMGGRFGDQGFCPLKAVTRGLGIWM